jgi:hypothetical protein
MKTLRDVLPPEALGYGDAALNRHLDRPVVTEFGGPGEPRKAWLGKHRNVMCWWQLEGGIAVGWNENPGRGWSFPVIRA